MLQIGLNSFSQEMVVSGTVHDTTGTTLLKGAAVTAVRLRDSVLLGFTRTDSNGEFVLRGFKVDTFSLTIQHPDFDNRRFFMFGWEENYEINISNIRMPAKTQEIEEVVIYAYKDPIYYRGDTLVYVADSFQVGQNAVVEDLFKKLPGIKIEKNGVITAQGEQVDRVLVDGDEFFGSDYTIATKNLEAKGVETVEVYEKENENSAGENKVKVIDIKLKKNYKHGYFGRLSGASDLALTPINSVSGTDPFYEGELLLNYFKNKRKVSVFALVSNTPVSSFGWGEMDKFGLANEDGANKNYWEVSTKSTDGIPRTLKTGVYFTDKFGKKKRAQILINYSYSSLSLTTASGKFTEQFLVDSVYYVDDSSARSKLLDNHRINLKLELPLGKKSTLEIKPSLAIGKSDFSGKDISSFFGSNYQQSLGTEISSSMEKDQYNFHNVSILTKKFKEKNRLLEVQHNVSWSSQNGNGFLYSLSDDLTGGTVNDTLDQNNRQNVMSIRNFAAVNYTEPLTKYLSLLGAYEFGMTKNQYEKSTFDFDGTNYSNLNPSLSTNFLNDILTNEAMIGLRFIKKKHVFRIGSKLKNISIQNFDQSTNVRADQNVLNALPFIFYQYKTSLTNKFTFDYSTETFVPTINDFIPIIDNSYPNTLRQGNPSLAPNYLHSFKFNHGKWEAISGRYMSTSLVIGYVNAANVDSITYDVFGRSNSTSVNVDGNLFSNARYGIGIPIFKKKAEVTASVNLSANRFKGYVAQQLNVTDDLRGGGSLGLDINLDSLEIFARASVEFSSPRSSLSPLSNTNLITQLHDLGFVWKLPLGFTLKSDITWRSFFQRGSDFFSDIFICNVSAGKNFLKTQNLSVEIIGNDIFNQNVNLERLVNQNSIVYNRTSLISRYFLLKATLRFNHNKTQEKNYNDLY